MRPSARLLLLAATVTLLSSCGHFRRVGQCRRLAERVNGAFDEIAAAYDAGGATAATYRDIANRYEQLGREVADMAATDDGFGRTLREYSAFFAETARVLRTLGDATERSDGAAAGRTRKELGNLLRRDKAMAARVEAACSDP